MKNNTEKSYTEYPSIDPPAPTRTFASRSKERMREDEMERYRERIRENIDYDLLLDDYPCDQETLDGYVDLIAGVCCSRRDYIRVSGEEMPTGVVKGRLLKLKREHIVYVMDSMRENTTFIRNIRAYTLAALYNAPMTMHSYYAARVNHDLYGSAS